MRFFATKILTVFFCLIFLITAGYAATISVIHGVVWSVIHGLCVFILALIGIYGATKEENCCLLTCAVGFVIYSIFAFWFGITGTIHNTPEKTTEQVKALYANRTNHIVANDIDKMHKLYQCCGIKNSKGPEVKEKDGTVMRSCCVGASETVKCKPENAYRFGCAEAIYEHKYYGGVEYIVHLILAFLTALFCVILAWQINRLVTDDDESY